VIVLNRLRELRQEKEISQKELAKMLKVQNSAISKYETGRVALSDETIKKLTAIFDVSADYLLGISDIKKEPTIKRQALPPVQQELLKSVEDLSVDETKKVREYAEFVKSQRKK
jgi:transcriptional regulator with XRE-family HTH domain